MERRCIHAWTTQHTACLPGHHTCSYPPGQRLASGSPPYQNACGALDHRWHDAHGRTGAVIVAIRRADGSFEVTPDADVELVEGDVVIGVGTAEEMRRLEELFAPRAVAAG